MGHSCLTWKCPVNGKVIEHLLKWEVFSWVNPWCWSIFRIRLDNFLFCCLIDHWRHSYWEASSNQYCRLRSLTGAKGNNVWNLRWITLVFFFCLDLLRQGSCLGKYWPFRVSLKWPSNESRKGQLNPSWWEHQKRNGFQLRVPGAISWPLFPEWERNLSDWVLLGL